MVVSILFSIGVIICAVFMRFILRKINKKLKEENLYTDSFFVH